MNEEIRINLLTMVSSLALMIITSVKFTNTKSYTMHS